MQCTEQGTIIPIFLLTIIEHIEILLMYIANLQRRLIELHEQSEDLIADFLSFLKTHGISSQ